MAAEHDSTAGGDGFFTDSLVADPSAPPDVRVLVGWPGASARKGCRRLYLTLALNEYLDIPEQDIRHSRPLARREQGVDRTIFWVNRDAKVQHTRTTAVEAHALFFQGSIAAIASRIRLSQMVGALGSSGSAADGVTNAGPACLITRGGPECAQTGPFDPNCCAVTEFPNPSGFGDPVP